MCNLPNKITIYVSEHTCTLARQQLSESVVDALASLVGAQAAARGAHKLFYTLQNTTHNKQLFYVSIFYLLFIYYLIIVLVMFWSNFVSCIFLPTLDSEWYHISISTRQFWMMNLLCYTFRNKVYVWMSIIIHMNIIFDCI